MPARKRRPRGHIEELASGSFRAIVYAGIDPINGRPRYLKETARTYDAAEAALTKLQSQVDDERHPKTNITVGHAIDKWLEVVDLAETTRGRYEDLIRIYIRPAFGTMPAAKLDAESLERFYANLQRCRSLCGKKPPRGHTCRPLAGATVRQIHYVISGALERAVRWGHLGLNKATFAVPPSPNRPDPDPPSAEEAARLLNAAWEDPDWGLLLWLTMTTGRRRGEVSGLRWKHVDFGRALLMVERNNVQPKALVIEKKTKSGTSPHVALDPYTMSLLEEHRERAIQRCNSIGCELTGEAWLFSLSPDGSTPYKPRSISQRYRRLASKLQLRSTRFHALRHYSATELIAARVDVRTVAGRLGQSDGGATALRIYAKFVNEADRLAAATMAGIIPRPIVAPPAPRGPYEVIAAQLREQISNGELGPGDQLPAIVDLAAAHTVSVGTAHRAVDLLKREGLVEASRGKRATVRSDASARRI